MPVPTILVFARCFVAHGYKANPEVRDKLSAAEIEANFDLSYHFKHVDTVFRRIFGAAK